MYSRKQAGQVAEMLVYRHVPATLGVCARCRAPSPRRLGSRGHIRAPEVRLAMGFRSRLFFTIRILARVKRMTIFPGSLFKV